jgi:hypothetical protein
VVGNGHKAEIRAQWFLLLIARHMYVDVILPNPYIIYLIEKNLNNHENLRKWVGNKLLYDRAMRWSDILQRCPNRIVPLSGNEILVTFRISNADRE